MTSINEDQQFATWEDISDSRLDNKIAIKVTWRYPDPGSRKDASMRVEDANGHEFKFVVWSKHEIDYDWHEGYWFVLNNARGSTWIDDGEVQKKLSSTRDMTVSKRGTDFEPTSQSNPDTQTEDSTQRGLLNQIENEVE